MSPRSIAYRTSSERVVIASFCWMCGDLVVGVAERDQAQDLQLALGEVIRGGGIGLGSEPSTELRLQVGAALGGHADGLDELLAGGLLEDVAQHAGLERLPGEGGLVLHGEHDDLRSRRLLPDRGDRRQSGPPRHVDVEDQHLGMVAADVPAGRVRVACLRNHLDVGFPLQHQAQGAADDGMVVSKNHRDIFGLCLPCL